MLRARIYNFLGENYKIQRHSILIYPNPSSGVITIQNYQPDVFKVTVHTLHGKEVYTGDMGTSFSTIDLGHLGKGLYVLILSSEKEMIHKKIMINR